MNEIEVTDLITHRTEHDVLFITTAAVWRWCRHSHFGDVLAKCYQADQKATFEEESKTLVQLNHENILKVYGKTSWEKRSAFILEFPECGNLHILQHEEKIKLPWKIKLNLFFQLICAVYYLHCELSSPYTHGLIKPENILLGKKLQVKLTGFEGCKDRSNPLYSAPELQRRMSLPDPAMDMYSLAMVLYELLIDQKVYYDSTMPLELLQVLIFSGVRPNLQRVEEVIELEKKKGKYHKFAEVANEVITTCWDGSVMKRLTIKEVRSRIEPLVSFAIKKTSLNIIEQKLHTREKKSKNQNETEISLNNFTGSFLVVESSPTEKEEIFVDDQPEVDDQTRTISEADTEIVAKNEHIGDQDGKVQFSNENATHQLDEPHIENVSGVYEFIDETSAVVGPNGAKLFAGGCSVDVPAGALLQSTKITINAYYGNRNETTGITPLLKCSPQGLQFYKPITITLGSSWISEKGSPTNCWIERSENGWIWSQYQPAEFDENGCITFKARHFTWWKVIVKWFTDLYHWRKRKTLQFMRKNAKSFECIFSENLLSLKEAESYPNLMHVDVLELWSSQSTIILKIECPNVTFQTASKPIEDAFFEIKDSVYFDIADFTPPDTDTCEITYTVFHNGEKLRKKTFRVDWDTFNVSEKLVNATRSVPNQHFYQFARRFLMTDEACIDDALTNFRNDFAQQRRHVLIAWKKSHGRNMSVEDLRKKGFDFHAAEESMVIEREAPLNSSQKEVVQKPADTSGPSRVVNANSATIEGGIVGQESLTMSNSPINNNCTIIHNHYYNVVSDKTHKPVKPDEVRKKNGEASQQTGEHQ